MIKLLAAFAALSMAGTLLLSLLPEGGVKRTASMTIGLLTLMCWLEGISLLLGIELNLTPPDTALNATDFSLETASANAASVLSSLWEVTP